MMMMTTRTATSNQMKMSPRSSENPTNRITKPQEGGPLGSAPPGGSEAAGAGAGGHHLQRAHRGRRPPSFGTPASAALRHRVEAAEDQGQKSGQPGDATL